MTTYKSILASAVAAVLALVSSDSLRAADYQIVAPPVVGQSTAPVAGCPTCAAASSSVGGCKSCGTSWFHHHDKGPYVVNLCPGACFGYFQTQWRKWDDVCPYPYQGIGVSDAPKPPSPVLPGVSKPGTTLPGPRPIDPKPGSDSKPGDIKPMSSITIPQIPRPGNGS
jgi:hypothetical protein